MNDSKIRKIVALMLIISFVQVAWAAPGPAGSPPTPNYSATQLNKVKAEGGNSSFQSLSVPNDLAGASIKIDLNGINNPGLNYNGTVQINDTDGLKLLNNSTLTSQGGGVQIGDSGAGGQPLLEVGKLVSGIFTSFLQVSDIGVLSRIKVNKPINVGYTQANCIAEGGYPNLGSTTCLYPLYSADPDGFVSAASNGLAIWGLSTLDTGIIGQTTAGLKAGVWGIGSTGSGVQGTATSGSGVFGLSTSGDGVLAKSTSGYGLEAVSETGTALKADTNGTNPAAVAGDFAYDHAHNSNRVLLGSPSNAIEAKGPIRQSYNSPLLIADKSSPANKAVYIDPNGHIDLYDNTVPTPVFQFNRSINVGGGMFNGHGLRLPGGLDISFYALGGGNQMYFNNASSYWFDDEFRVGGTTGNPGTYKTRITDGGDIITQGQVKTTNGFGGIYEVISPTDTTVLANNYSSSTLKCNLPTHRVLSCGFTTGSTMLLKQDQYLTDDSCTQYVRNLAVSNQTFKVRITCIDPSGNW